MSKREQLLKEYKQMRLDAVLELCKSRPRSNKMSGIYCTQWKGRLIDMKNDLLKESKNTERCLMRGISCNKKPCKECRYYKEDCYE